LRAPKSFTQERKGDRGGMVYRKDQVKLAKKTLAKKTLAVTTYELPDGKLEQCLVLPE
jgi:hypothetical protein